MIEGWEACIFKPITGIHAHKCVVIEDEKVTYVPVEVEMWCNKPTKEIENE